MAASPDSRKIKIFEFDPLLAQELAVPRADPRSSEPASGARLQSKVSASNHGRRQMNLNILFWTVNIVIGCLVLTNIYIASLKDRSFARDVAERNRQTEQLRFESEKQRERAAMAEAKLQDQTGSTTVSWRLKRLETLVLPRSLTVEQQTSIGRDFAGFGPINIAFKQGDAEPEAYAMTLMSVFQGAGILGQVFYLQGSHYQGVDLLFADDKGKQLADKLHQIGVVDFAGPANPPSVGYENLPRNQNTLVVGDNAAIFNPDVGKPAEASNPQGDSVSQLEH